MEKHIFAFYTEKLSHLIEQTKENDVFAIKDATLWNRLVKIVRIRAKERFVLFDDAINVTFACDEKTSTEKRTVIATVIEKSKNKPIEPTLTLYLPILKKEAFEYVAYVAAQMGVTSIVPVVTKKSETKVSSRLKKIFIAACEQSKNFVAPQVHEPIALTDLTEESLIYFSEHGTPLSECVEKIKSVRAIIVGPEGGFTKEEEDLLRKRAQITCALTPTILRSREAASLGIGIVRSLI